MFLAQRPSDSTGPEELYWAFKGNKQHRALSSQTLSINDWLVYEASATAVLHDHPDILIGTEQDSKLRHAHLRKPKTFTKCCKHLYNPVKFSPTGNPLLRLQRPQKGTYTFPHILPPESPSVGWAEIFHISHTWGVLVTPKDPEQMQQIPVPIFLVP